MIRAVLFDCDGVLADSEAVVNAEVAAALTARGWAMDAAAAERAFLGLAWPDMRPVIEARTGPLPPGWEEALGARILQALRDGLRPVPGAAETLARLRAKGLPMACCSNSSRAELALKLRALGFAGFFPGRALSFEDVARPKPAPDLYEEAARRCGAPPAACLVVEDSDPGAAAGIAAGCRVLRVRGRLDPAAVLHALS